MEEAQVWSAGMRNDKDKDTAGELAGGGGGQGSGDRLEQGTRLEKSEWWGCIHATNTVEYPQGDTQGGGLSTTQGLVNKVR